MAQRKAIATLLIGDKYQEMWQSTFRESWMRYAARHGYDIVLLRDYVDPSPRGRERSPHWQKCLILEHPGLKDYEDVVWIDADILINFHTAPCIVEYNNSDRIGVVTYRGEFAVPGRVDNRYHRRAYSGSGGKVLRSPEFPDWYAQNGLGRDIDDFINTGVLVMKPRLHTEFMRWFYDTAHETTSSHQENGALSYWLLKKNICNAIDPRFNVSWNGDVIEFYTFLLEEKNFHNDPLISLCVTQSWHNAYMLHFVESATRHHARLVRVDRSTAPGLALSSST